MARRQSARRPTPQSARRPTPRRAPEPATRAQAALPDAARLRVLCVHGVGNHERDLTWQARWRDAIARSVERWAPRRPVALSFLRYQQFFDAAAPSRAGTAEAVWKLAASGPGHGVDDLFRPRGQADVPDRVRWTAGMVVQWAEDARLRRATRERLTAAVRAFRPDVICAHSLGSLIAYDTFSRPAGRSLLAGRLFASFGSQIGVPFVRDRFGGRIAPLGARQWVHLYNPHDEAFTAEIDIRADVFEQVLTPFALSGSVDGDAHAYLDHPRAVERLWRPATGVAVPRALQRSQAIVARAARRPRRRALLVGINDYPDLKDRLEGCLNDVFLMSAVLQETGFDPEDIRVVLDDRASAAGIRERLQWLLEGAAEGDQRIFYYSGHGAQLPGYGAGEKVDAVDECLVPHDFDWSPERAVTDDHLFDLYSQLPYGTRFAMVLDCCHSGGLTRDGRARVRGITGPDDVRHRMLRWSAREEMWVPRDLPPINPTMTRQAGGRLYQGASGATRRLGRAARLRSLPNAEYDRARREHGHAGPYLPIIMQACHEDQLSYEYRHGVQSHGAFTYALARTLRRYRTLRRAVSFERLIVEVTATLRALQYEQTPTLLGPRALVRAAVPWLPRG